ncbi:MAG: heavy-metal-associated domain-containing protein [Cyclobacteriaceae bacterium]
MSKFKYKTNINCDNCVKTVTPYLDSIQGAEWSVDVSVKDKTLSVTGENLNSESVIEKVREAGFNISEVKKNPLKFW